MTLPTAASPYDDIAFPGQCVPQAHPDRLSAVAALFGMPTQAVDRCRVLELGCATGGNLLPMAERHPESSFVGIDSSQRQIAAATEQAAALGLGNIELRHLAIGQVSAELGMFDYIICHGVYSWVAPDVQDQLLAVCRANLRPRGVAFVSYNTFPGWHLQDTIRFLVCGAAGANDPAAMRLAAARKLLDALSDILTVEQSPYGRELKRSIDALLLKPDGYLFHDHMEADNHPVYFHQFIERAAAHHLDYVADAEPGTMFVSALGPLVEEALLRIAGDLVSVEQHLDVLRNRAFRQSLLCHRGIPLVRQMRAASAYGLRFSSQASPADPARDIAASEPQEFLVRGAPSVSLSAPPTRAALIALSRVWPHTMSFDELAAAAAEQLASRGGALSADDRDLLGRELVYLALGGVVDIHTAADRFVTSISRYPAASPCARAQALASAQVTNRRHELIGLDDMARSVILHLDGSNDRAALMAILDDAVERGEITILKDALPARRGEQLAGVLESILDRTLSVCAAHALLIA